MGDGDREMVALNYFAAVHLAQVEVTAITGTTRLFRDPGALEARARLACAFFDRHLRHGVTGAALRGTR